MRYSYIIFDLDGTLMDSIQGIATSVNRMLKRHQYPIFSTQEYVQFVGSGLYNTVKAALQDVDLDEATLEALYKEMLKDYDEEYDDGLKPYDGAKELLQKLEGQAQLVIYSNKNDDMVKTIVHQYLGAFNFRHVLGLQEEKPLKPSPWAVKQWMMDDDIAPKNILFVGDSEVDVLTAKNAGVDSCFVTWGFRHREHVLSYNPTYVVDDFKTLYSIIKGAEKNEK